MNSDLAPRERMRKIKTGFTLTIVMLILSALLFIATRQMGNLFGVLLFGFFSVFYYRQLKQIEHNYPQVVTSEKGYPLNLKKR